MKYSITFQIFFITLCILSIYIRYVIYFIGQNPILGDMYALIGATLYAVTNVAQEYSVKYFTRLEFLGLIGFFGSFIGGVQL